MVNTDKHKILLYWFDKNLPIKPPWDLALQYCWCCGCKSLLERAHIIPAALHGDDSCSNLLLLCRGCNESNPETIFEEDYWKWFNSRVNAPNSMFIDDSAKEYEVMYDKKFVDLSRFLQNYMTEDEISDKLNKYIDEHKDHFSIKTKATTAVVLHKFSEYLKNQPILVTHCENVMVEYTVI
jgi:hypothetical protein